MHVPVHTLGAFGLGCEGWGESGLCQSDNGRRVEAEQWHSDCGIPTNLREHFDTHEEPPHQWTLYTSCPPGLPRGETKPVAPNPNNNFFQSTHQRRWSLSIYIPMPPLACQLLPGQAACEDDVPHPSLAALAGMQRGTRKTSPCSQSIRQEHSVSTSKTPLTGLNQSTRALRLY